MRFTKDYIGKTIRVICSSCGTDMQTKMIDVNRTPKYTICKSCKYENDHDTRWYQEK